MILVVSGVLSPEAQLLVNGYSSGTEPERKFMYLAL